MDRASDIAEIRELCEARHPHSPDESLAWLAVHRLLRAIDDSAPVNAGAFVVRPYPGPTVSDSTSSMPWCGVCAGFHIPGAGPCNATYTNIGYDGTVS